MLRCALRERIFQPWGNANDTLYESQRSHKRGDRFVRLPRAAGRGRGRFGSAAGPGPRHSTGEHAGTASHGSGKPLVRRGARRLGPPPRAARGIALEGCRGGVLPSGVPSSRESRPLRADETGGEIPGPCSTRLGEYRLTGHQLQFAAGYGFRGAPCGVGCETGADAWGWRGALPHGSLSSPGRRGHGQGRYPYAEPSLGGMRGPRTDQRTLPGKKTRKAH